MIKIILTTVILLNFFIVSGQEIIKKEDKHLYNKWSVEFNTGNNKPLKPFSPGYSTSDDKTVLKTPVNNHFDIGVRRMFSTKFGLKLDIGSDIIENQKGSSSLDFYAKQNSISFQGLINLGRISGFEVFTNTFGLLTNFGIQVSQFNLGKLKEYNGGVIMGITPLAKLSERFLFSGNFSILVNTRQHLNWDGGESDSNKNLIGTMNYIKLGVIYYIGKNENHADWYIPKKVIDFIGPQQKEFLNVFYDFNKDEPNLESVNAITQIMSFLKSSQDNMVIFRGYADIEEGEDLSLVQLRPENLKNIFIANNIDSGRISILKSNEDEENKDILDKTTPTSSRRVFVTLFNIK
jgi:hypothetical protein